METSQVERAPARRHPGVAGERLQEPARLGVGEPAQHVAMQPLDQRRRHRLPSSPCGGESRHGGSWPHRVAAERGHSLGGEQRCDQAPRGGVGVGGCSSAGQARWPDTAPAGRSMRSSARRTWAMAGASERGGPVRGRMAGGDEQVVAVTQRHVEHPGQEQDHLAAGLARPVSTKLRWRDDTPASTERFELAHARAARATGGAAGQSPARSTAGPAPWLGLYTDVRAADITWEVIDRSPPGAAMLPKISVFTPTAKTVRARSTP